MAVLAFDGKLPIVAQDVFVANGAAIIGDVTVGGGSSIWFNAVLRGDYAAIVIGQRSNVQDNATIHVDIGIPATIGHEVTIGHGAIVHGATLEDHVLVGMNAVILNGARIGRGSIVGAGAVVSQGAQIPPLSLVLGVPGKVRRQLSEAEGIGEAVARAERYCRLAGCHRGS